MRREQDSREGTKYLARIILMKYRSIRFHLIKEIIFSGARTFFAARNHSPANIHLALSRRRTRKPSPRASSPQLRNVCVWRVCEARSTGAKYVKFACFQD